MFRTTAAVKSVCDITPELLYSMGVKGLLLDIDNTLTTHDNPIPPEDVIDWLLEMKRFGIQMCLISNNHEARVAPFAQQLEIPYVCESAKPLGKGFWESNAENAFEERAALCRRRPDLYRYSRSKLVSCQEHLRQADSARDVERT